MAQPLEHTIFYWKSQKGFLPVREASQFPQKPESWRKGSPTADTRTKLRVQSIPARVSGDSQLSRLASTACSKLLIDTHQYELHIDRSINTQRLSLALPHISSASSLGQNITKLHIPSDVRIFSATIKDCNTVVLVMTMDAVTYYFAYFPILSSNYFDNTWKWVHAIHWKFFICLFEGKNVSA